MGFSAIYFISEKNEETVQGLLNSILEHRKLIYNYFKDTGAGDMVLACNNTCRQEFRIIFRLVTTHNAPYLKSQQEVRCLQ